MFYKFNITGVQTFDLITEYITNKNNKYNII